MVLVVSAINGYVIPLMPPFFLSIFNHAKWDSSVSVEQPITSTFFDLNSFNLLWKSWSSDGHIPEKSFV